MEVSDRGFDCWAPVRLGVEADAVRLHAAALLIDAIDL